MKIPKFITFTGVDEKTNLIEMHYLASKYPVEFGILFSTKRQGNDPRYPSIAWVKTKLLPISRSFPISAHLCGDDCREVLGKGSSIHDRLIHEYFGRVQLNTNKVDIDLDLIKCWADRVKVKTIIQCREKMPSDHRSQWLFDISGGQGKTPTFWPEPGNETQIYGYAGGLNKANVMDSLEKIPAKTDYFWIDMETGVRDENNNFSLDLCREVCEKVYGKGVAS